MHLYKSQILSYIESSTPGIYHAAPSVLQRVDHVQERFLSHVGLCERVALMDYRLAPLAARRDMAMLGVLHKIVLGQAPAPLAALFPFLGEVFEPVDRQRLRNWRPRHGKQLSTEADFASSDVMQRSLFGVVLLYNRLPQSVVDAPSVRVFQARLQGGLKEYARSGIDRWQRLFSTEWRLMPLARLHALFE